MCGQPQHTRTHVCMSSFTPTRFTKPYPAGGGSKTAMFANIRPSDMDISETVLSSVSMEPSA